MQIAAFDVVDTGDFVDEVLEQEASEPINEKYETIGFETIQFINNVGTFFFVMFAYVIMIAIWGILAILQTTSRFVSKIKTKLGNKLFWNAILVAIIESFLIIAICILIYLSQTGAAFDTKS